MTFTKFEEFMYKQEFTYLPIHILLFITFLVLTLVSQLLIIPLFILSFWLIFVSHFSNKRKLFERKLELGEYY